MPFLTSIWNAFYPDNFRIENEKKLKTVQAAIDKQIQNQEFNTIPNSYQNNIQTEQTKIIEATNCFRTTGILTLVDSNYAIIDNEHIFNVTQCGICVENLKVGSTVEYIGYRPQGLDGNIKVSKVLTVSRNSWDENEMYSEEIVREIANLRDERSEYFKIHRQNQMGIVIERSEHFLKVFTDTHVWINFDELSMEFVPQEGDRIILHCIVQTDETFVDSAGETLEYKAITPAIQKNISGFVTSVDEEWGVGIINEDCYYMFEMLELGCKPCKGDRVSAEVIENNRHEKYNWRCIKITIVEKSLRQLKKADVLKDDAEFVLDKNGITITKTIRFKFEKIMESDVKELVITNESNRQHKILRSCLRGSKRDSQLIVLEPNLKDSIFLIPGESVVYKIRAEAGVFGMSTEIFECSFGGSFKIARKIEIEVGDPSDENYSQHETKVGNNVNFKKYAQNYASYHRSASKVWRNFNKGNLLPGVGITQVPRFVKIRIGQFEVPDKLKFTVLNTTDYKEMVENVEAIYPSLTTDVNFDNYVSRFQCLLHIEEIYQFIQFRRYDQERAHFGKEGEYLRLEIENLHERRPSLIIGDMLHAKNPWVNTKNDDTDADADDDAPEQKIHQAWIHKVLFNRILVKFHPDFHNSYNGEDYKLEFFFSRFTYRKQHYAIQKIIRHLKTECLFPTKVVLRDFPILDVCLDQNISPEFSTSLQMNWFNPYLNEVQQMAVVNILRGEASPLPYVIFGPPGTGKTITLIETILQIFANCSSARILIGTPSNSSADLIATRLIESNVLNRGDFIRLVAQNLIEKELIAEHLKPYCATIDIAIEGTRESTMLVTESGLKLRCQKQHLGQHRITIGTCITLGTLIQLGFSKDHFTHVILDEAGQCTEPESMVIISQVDNKSGQIILAGDPLQLGPIVLHKFANSRGLGKSYLSRLLQSQPYAKDRKRFPGTGFNHRLVTKLIYNYRSLPSILNTFNDIFYSSELLPCVDPNNSPEVQLLNAVAICLPTYSKRAPHHGALFFGIRGENRQDRDSPSWYNAEEARQLFLFVIKLYKLGIDPDRIGIITPYQMQVRKIRNLFKTMDDLRLPKIGSVEEFQGQERDIILISTVRSSKSLLQSDLNYTLGFVQNEKRMNVAISRARSLLIIFGNPHLLSLDANWEKLLRYCVENNAYSGCDLPRQFHTK